MNKGKPTLKDKEQVTGYEMQLVDETDHLAIDPVVLEDIKSKNLAYRWINAVKFKDMHGFDSRRWMPYKAEIGSNKNNAYGYADSEGYIRRGDMLLAVQPMHINEARKTKIANRNKTLSSMQSKQAAQELRNALGSSGKVIEGYDENE
jgi:hypothetical protein